MNDNSKIISSAKLQDIPLKKIAKAIHVPEPRLRQALRNKTLRFDQIALVCEILNLDQELLVSKEEPKQQLSNYNTVFMEGKIFC